MSDKCSNILATCDGACLIIPVQRHHVSETMRRRCSVKLSLDPCGSFVFSGMSNSLKNKLLFQVNLQTVKSYQVSGTRNALHSIVMANGRTFQLQFDDSAEFDAFEPYLRMAIESLNLKNMSDDFLIVEPPKMTSGNGNIGKVKISGTNILNRCDASQIPTYLPLLSSQLSDEQNESLDDGYEKICEERLSNYAPTTSARCAPPVPKRSGMKSEQRIEGGCPNTDTINRRPLPPLPINTTTKHTTKLNVREQPRLSKRSKSEDWSRDEEGYELPRQLQPSHRNVLKSDEGLNDYTRLSNSFAASSSTNSLTGSLHQLNTILPHPRVVHLAEPCLKSRSSEDLNSPKLALSIETKPRVQHASRAQRVECLKKVASPLKMKHAESHGDLSIGSNYEPMVAHPARDARSVTPPPSYAPLTPPRSARCNGPPTPPSRRRGVNVPINPLFHSESTLAMSCPDGLNRIETRTHKIWSNNACVREALSSMPRAPAASSLPNLARDVFSPSYPMAGRRETSSFTSSEESSQRHRMVVLKLHKHVKQTVVHSKLGTFIN